MNLALLNPLALFKQDGRDGGGNFWPNVDGFVGPGVPEGFRGKWKRLDEGLADDHTGRRLRLWPSRGKRKHRR